MTIGLILAGGIDNNFKMSVPKQFVNVFNRPVIVYTMEVFQKHPEIDKIAVACLDGWQEMVKAYVKQFNISKCEWILIGGQTAQETIWKSIQHFQDICADDDLIVIHDSIRPYVGEEVISNSIKVCKENGMGVAAIRTMDTIMMTDDGIVGTDTISRYSVVRIQTPQTFSYRKLLDIYERGNAKGIHNEVDTISIAAKIGEMIYFSKGSDLNMKINSVEDVERFKALYKMTHET